jgi:serine/threonine protein kinase
MGEAKGLVGSVLSDTYRLERLLGEGGMGAVYKAAHLRLDRRFAIKVLLSSSSNAEMVARFQREARITSGIGHPNIVEVTDFQHLPDGRPYIVMELLEGEDLGHRLERQPPLELSEVRSILTQAAAGLQAAHDRDVVHRDLKPQNIFLCPAGEGELLVKVLDFGISKVLTSKSRLTRTRTMMGTPYYMAPEQAEQRQADVGVQTDVWAMGTIVFEMIAGIPPFEGDSVPGLLYLIVHKPPAPLHDLRPDAPEPVRYVIEKALSKRPEDRYASVTEFAQEFGRALEVTERAQTSAQWREAQRIWQVVSDEWDAVAAPGAARQTASEPDTAPPELLSLSEVRTPVPDDEEETVGRSFDDEPTPHSARIEDIAHVLEEPDVDLPTDSYPALQAAAPILPPQAPPEPTPAPGAAPEAAPAGEEAPVQDERAELVKRFRKLAKLTTISSSAGELYQRVRERVGWWVIPIAAAVVVAGLSGFLYRVLHVEEPQLVAAKAVRPAVPPRATAVKASKKAAKAAPPKPEKKPPPAAAPRPRDPEEPFTRLLWLSSTPAEADVFWDGERVGLTPIKGARISQNAATLEVRSPGFENWARPIGKGAEHLVLQAVLKPERPARPARRPRKVRPVRRKRPDDWVYPGVLCSLRVVTLRQGVSIWADIYLDGKAVGQSPKVLGSIRPGAHSIRVQRPGFRPKTVQVRLRPGRRQKLSIKMEQIDGLP